MKYLRRTFQWLAAIAVVVVVLACVGVIIAPRFGWSANIVGSGSMEPALKVGSMVILRPVDAAMVREGDVIAYRPPTNPNIRVTHRVVKVNDMGGEALTFSTKGDANEEPDIYTVPAQNVIGRVSVSIPYVGYIKQSVSTPFGLWLLIGVPAALIVLMELRSIFTTIREEQRDKRWISMLLAEDDQPKKKARPRHAKRHERDDDPIWTLEGIPHPTR